MDTWVKIIWIILGVPVVIYILHSAVCFLMMVAAAILGWADGRRR